MKLITRDTDYAVRALMYIARSGERVITAADLVKSLNMPRPFLRKILQLLHKNGILKASKGYGGGFSLGLAANKIYLRDLMGIFQGQLRLNECIFKKKVCLNRNTCPLKKELDSIERYVISKLEGISIASLLKQ